jgi:hypothetical protein
MYFTVRPPSKIYHALLAMTAKPTPLIGYHLRPILVARLRYGELYGFSLTHYIAKIIYATGFYFIQM